MQRYFAYVLMLSAMLNCQENGGKLSYKYYRQLDISQIHHIIPKYPVNKELAENGACWELSYDRQGRLVDASYIRMGFLSVNSDLKFAHIAIKYGRGKEIRSYLDQYGKPIERNLGISEVAFSFNDTGKIISKSFYNDKQENVVDSLGVAKYIYNYDSEDENSLTMLRLDAQGDTIIDKKGIFKTILRLNSDGYITELSYLDRKDNPVDSDDGISMIRRDYDDKNNWTETRFYDKSGNLAVFKITGAAVSKVTYDNNGYPEYLYCYDANMELTDNTSSGYAMAKRYYANNGLLLKLENIKSDYSSSQVYKFNKYGQLLEIGFYDSAGNYTISSEAGYAILRVKYDDKSGNAIEQCFFDQNEQLIEPKKFGYAIHRAEYDEHGKLAEEYYLGADLQPRFDNFKGFSKAIFKYDERGNIIKTQKYDVDGSLINTE